MNSIFINVLLLIATATFLVNCSGNLNKDKVQDDLQLVIPETGEYDSTIYEPIYQKLKEGKELSKSEIDSFASSIETRAEFYNILQEFNQTVLFPSEYYSFEKASESVLTNWLLFPTELDTIPSKIELVKKVSFTEHDTTFTYYVHQFKTDPPHWAAEDGWMLGVVGPYIKDTKPYDWVAGTFSKFSKVTETTPEKEVDWIHKNVYRRKPE